MESGSMARMLLLMIRLKRSKRSALALIRMMSVTFDLFIWLFVCEFVCKGKKKVKSDQRKVRNVFSSVLEK